MKNDILDGDAEVHDLVVVAFDMCSSSRILEDLTRTDSLKQYDRLLKGLREWLSSDAKASKYVLYKFTGDGWLLLFPADGVTGDGLMSFLLRLSKAHQSYREKFIDDHLESIPAEKGLTYGVEMGSVRKLVLGDEVEFVGRAINVACRLQAAVKDKGRGPDYRCLLSRRVYNTYMKKLAKYTFVPVKRTLRNISGGEDYRCYKVDFTSGMKNI